jgi:hypothetical protein
VEITPEFLEEQLKQRLQYPYDWQGKRQNNINDRLTNFVYSHPRFEDFLKECESRGLSPELFQYALNRWYNFWTAYGAEKVFTSYPGVEPAREKSATEDFYIEGVPFDLKQSVCPKGFKKSVRRCSEIEGEERRNFVEWMYENQSQRYSTHYGNKLFVVYDDRGGEHWKMKSDLGRLNEKVRQFIKGFDLLGLERFRFKPGFLTFSDLLVIAN